MKYRCFIAALLLHLIIVMCFFVPEKNIDAPKATYIHAYLEKNNISATQVSFLRKRESSKSLKILDPRLRKDDSKKHKSENTKNKIKNTSTNNSQATKLAIYLHNQIQQNLANANLPDSMQNQKIQIEFTLTNTGIIKDIKLQQSTGFKITDQEIINAVANIQTIPAKLLLATTQQFRLDIIIDSS